MPTPNSAPQEPSQPRILTGRQRPRFPARAVITAGMPYGNKDLHFGHVGGVFVHADTFARFLRGRIGADNVIFVSGTDCYGSPIVADHARRIATGEFAGDLMAYVGHNHRRQAQTLERYGMSLDCFAASALEPYRETHRRMGAMLMRELYRNGHLEKRSTPQFYDAQRGMYLNGRQVTGRCPVQGCKSEKAYADECSLGHQYEPRDLIHPVSTLSGERPEMREVTNWYVKLEEFRAALRRWLEERLERKEWRDYSVRMALEHFEPPAIYVKREVIDTAPSVFEQLPPHTRETGKGESDKLIFANVAAIDEARSLLTSHQLQYRTGKNLAPFRLTGNLEWGLPAPAIDGLGGLTFWVWPESLWAPISFSAEVLRARGADPEAWRRWWASPDAMAYQFIGEDNLYFYGVAEMAMFLGTQPGDFTTDAPGGSLQLPRIIANRHILFLDKKASSSGEVKPPMADELLAYYSPEQLRIHFLSLALATRNANFRPKPLDPAADPRGVDPVLKDGNILTNAFNKSARSCFYTVQKYYEGTLPPGEASAEVVERCELAILDYEEAMSGQDFPAAVGVVSDFINAINARWTRQKPFKEDCDPETRRQALVDAFEMVRVATVLLHPIAPIGTERIREYLGVGEELWSWGRIFTPITTLIANTPGHRFLTLEPRVDFFERPACQLKDPHPDSGSLTPET